MEWFLMSDWGLFLRARKSDGKFKTPLILRSDSPCGAAHTVEIEGEEGPLLHTVSFYRYSTRVEARPKG
jgi:hypothetical protein